MIGTRTKLSALWLFATLNFIYCDVVGLFDPEQLKKFIAGNLGFIDVTPGFLFATAVLIEIPIAMVLVSRVVADRPNRWANIIAGGVMTLVQVGSLFTEVPTAYYVFFSVVEIAATLAIVAYAWRWQVGSAAAPVRDMGPTSSRLSPHGG